MPCPLFALCASCGEAVLVSELVCGEYVRSACDDCCFTGLMKNLVGPAFAEKLGSEETFGLVLKYLTGSSRRKFRKEYWRGILNGAPWTWSPFWNLFTYCGNGMAGNISRQEDIADRIVAFIVGKADELKY